MLMTLLVEFSRSSNGNDILWNELCT